MTSFRIRDVRASAVLLLAGMCTLAPAALQGQVAGLVETGTRYAGNSAGTSIYSGDVGTASATSLNAPSYAVFDSTGNLFVSDTNNNCVRKIDTAGNITTVAGLRVNGNPDTCNAALNATPTAAQGLYKPTGLAIDSANTLYIADSQHNCVRSLAAGAVDSFALNALTTVAGTCTSTDTASVTPVPNGLAVDAGGNLYISVRDSAAVSPVNQVLLHAAAAPATSVCLLAGQPSASVSTNCPGVTGTATLSNPAGLAFDPVGDLFIADTGNNCVRELAGMTTLQTAVGQCANDGSGSTSSALQSPYGLAFTPAAALLITQSSLLQNSVVSFSAATGALTLVAGLPSGTPGVYSALLDGQSALSTPLDAPLGVTTNSAGEIYLADSLNNVLRRYSTDASFPSTAIGAISASQTLTFAIYANANLTTIIGADYTITANTCTGPQTAVASPASPTTCQITLTFTPTLPGARVSALQLKDSISGALLSVGLNGTAIGPLSLLAPGTSTTLASGLRTPIVVSVDSSGNSYVLEQGDAISTADLILIPAGGGPTRTVIPQGAGISTPTAMAVDGAGNIFIAEGATNTISRFGADGSVNLNYASGVTNASALVVDNFDNLYVAQAGSTHNVIEIYAGGARRTIAGSGSTAAADGIAASSAQFVKPTGLALGPGGLAIADASGQYVYTVDSSGVIHIVAGNGSSVSTNTTQATGTAILYPVGLAYDAAGDLYIADGAANQVYEVFPLQSSGVNILTAFGSGASGNTDGPALQATLRAPLSVVLDGSANLYVVDSGNSSLREVTYPTSKTIDFGNVVIGNHPTLTETVINAGNASLGVTVPITTTDSHFTIAASSTCSSSLVAGGVCAVGYTFTPTAQGPVTATSSIASTSLNSPFNISLSGFGLQTQILPFTLMPETEVYGQPYTITVQLNVNYPDLAPDGTMTFSIGGNQTCIATAPFATTVLCSAPNSHLHVLSPYTVNFAYAANSADAYPNYFSASGTTTLTVTPAPLTVTTASTSKYYGDPIVLPNPKVAFSGLANGDVFVALDSTTATATSPIGTYPINSTLSPVGSASTSDYSITDIPGVLTVLARPLTVTIANLTRPYGAANPTLTGTVNGVVNGDTFTITYSTTATTTSPVGNYPITATVSGTNISQYAVTVVAGTLTVTPIPLTVNVANASRAYGTANPTFTSTIAGAINGDTFTQNLTTTALINSPVGTYPINDVVGGPAAGNYTITINPGTLTITPAVVVLTVSANNATRPYGAPNPVFTSVVTGALFGDTFTITYTTSATLTSPVGAYGITPVVSGAAAANYTVVTNNGTLTVTPAVITVTAANATRQYNVANPVFTSTVAGLLNGDTVTASYSTTATITSPVGNYPIVPALAGAALSNYTVNAVNGTLTITPQVVPPLVVAVNNATRVYGAANPIFTGTVTGLLNGDTVVVSYATAANATSAPGTYPITATISGAAAANYTLNMIPGTLTVTQAPTTLTLTTSGSPVYSGSSVTFNVTVSGNLIPAGTVTLLNGSSVLTTLTLDGSGNATFTTSALPAGSLTIAANYAGNVDFLASSSSLTQVVTPGTFTLAATPATQFVRGAGATVYSITATSAQGFAGPVTLACSGLPADATCSFATPTLTLTSGGTATTTMTVTTTSADAKLLMPELPRRTPGSHLAPIAFAATLPFELTGLGVFFAGLRRRKRLGMVRAPRLLLLAVTTVALFTLAGCACFTSVYQNYTINVTGTTTVSGVSSATTSVILSVGQQ